MAANARPGLGQFDQACCQFNSDESIPSVRVPGNCSLDLIHTIFTGGSFAPAFQLQAPMFYYPICGSNLPSLLVWTSVPSGPSVRLLGAKASFYPPLFCRAHA